MTARARLPAATEAYVGARLRMRRKAMGLTTASLARSVCLSAPDLHAFEAGWRRPSASALSALARALGVPVLDLFPPNLRR